MTHAGHGRIVCSCGEVIAQCRCPDPNKTVDVRQSACAKCKGAQPVAQIGGDTSPDGHQVHAVTVKVMPLHVDASPPLQAYQVVVETARTEWRETFGSEDALRAFVRGVRAGAAAGGIFDVAEEQ